MSNRSVSASKSITESDARLSAIINNVVDGIITIDKRGTVASFNPAAERIFGYSASEVIDQNVKMLMPEPYHGEHDQYLINYLTTGDAKIIGHGREVRGLRKDGSTFPFALAVGDASGEGEEVFVGILRDLTQQKAAEEEIEQQIARYQRLVLELSTPVIELWKGLLLLPLIGELSAERATQVNESLLNAILEHEARIAIVDVTGVPVIDTNVAQHLMRTVSAARMMGAQVVVTGFSPEAAQTLTSLGVDLDDLDTRGSLRAGVTQGLRQLGFTVTAGPTSQDG